MIDLLDEIEDELRELLAEPPERFVGARDDLARRLREEGSWELSRAVRSLRRPSAALWAVNRVAQGAPEAVAAILEAAQELKQAQRRVLAGDPGVELVAPAEAHRRAVFAAVDAVHSLLAAESRSLSAPMRDRIRDTLAAASLDETARPLLASGRLTHEVRVTAVGFDEGSLPATQSDEERERLREEAARRAEQRARARRIAEDGLEDAERSLRGAEERLTQVRARREEHERRRLEAERDLLAARRAREEAEAVLARAMADERGADKHFARVEEEARKARSLEERAAAAVDEARRLGERARARMRRLDTGGSERR